MKYYYDNNSLSHSKWNCKYQIVFGMSFHDWGFPKISIFLDAYI